MGGAETLLVNSLAKGGLQEHADNILVYFQGDSVLLNKIDSGVIVINLGYKGWYSIFSLLKKIKNIIRKYKPDIIHTHLNPAGWYTALICPKNIPQVHTMHVSYSDDTDTGKMRLFFERFFLLQKKNISLITLSPFLKEDLLGSVKIKGRIFVLSNFIDDIFFTGNPPAPLPDGKFRFVAVGNIRPQKNYAYLLEIFRHLKNEPVSVDVYGFGNHDTFSGIAEKEGINVFFKGAAADTKNIYWKYDAFIMPSNCESFGLTAYEAMASGLPLLLSNLAAFESILEENALYFTLNSAEGASETIKKFITDKNNNELRAKKAKNYAGTIVRREKYISGLLSIYKEILN